jgi:outer membrane receptor protein involved in Fe transport
MKLKFAMTPMALSVALAAGATAVNAQENAEQEDKLAMLEEVMVVGRSVSYANNAASQEMKAAQSNMTSVLAVIDNLPGVLVNEGDTFGTDDWSTTISIRGFQVNLSEQQLGITVDGIANGNSNYGGGAKANRYIDTENLETVEVSQGTADVASRSNEALGGTLNFTTRNPGEEEQLVVSYTTGDFEAQKYYVRYETGELMADTYAWVSLSSASNTDWINQSAENERDHFAAKIVSTQGNMKLTAYGSYDDTHEDNYQRISLKEFSIDPNWDRLTAEWTGVPYVDQLYRKGWSTLRENLFGYLQADWDLGSLQLSANVYYHDNEGRGDWVPQYVVDVFDDGAGVGNSELQNGVTRRGGSPLGRIYFVDKDGVALAPMAGCESSITFPYGGSGPEADPACHAAGAIPVGSYRHTHYAKERLGFNADFDWIETFGDIENTLRGGIWYEDYNREEYRDWHKVIDSRVGYNFDHQAYWVQYEKEFPVETTMFYLEYTVKYGPASVRLGAKKFLVDLERKDKMSGESLSVSSDSDTLLSAGIVVDTPVEGLEVFAGYGENFAAIKDSVLERESSALDNIEPETAENIDVGLRFVGDRINASLTYYDITFENRLTFFAPDSPDGIDYLIGTNGAYVNVGGIESSGIEASLTVNMTETLQLYVSATSNESEYVGGNSAFPAGNTVAGSTEDMAVVSLDWAKDKYLAGLSAKWVGERYLQASNTDRVDAYTTADLYAGVSLELGGAIKTLDVRLTVNNLFDERYLGGISGGSAWIGAARTAAINVSASF